jgi:hypothetical protein
MLFSGFSARAKTHFAGVQYFSFLQKQWPFVSICAIFKKAWREAKKVQFIAHSEARKGDR